METAIDVNFIRTVTRTTLLAMLLPCAAAQAQLPAPSRTIYKCVVKGAVSYSDEPCEGAQRLDATPIPVPAAEQWPTLDLETLNFSRSR